MKWSTSGISAARSRPYFWTMQPATMTRSISPASLRATSRRIAPTDSSLAASMNPHVFTMTTRDFSGSVSVSPSFWRCPSMTSVSTRFFGQPSDTMPTEGRRDPGDFIEGEDARACGKRPPTCASGILTFKEI